MHVRNTTCHIGRVKHHIKHVCYGCMLPFVPKGSPNVRNTNCHMGRVKHHVCNVCVLPKDSSKSQKLVEK